MSRSVCKSFKAVSSAVIIDNESRFNVLGIIGAMDSEVAELKNEMENAGIDTIAGMDFYKGTISGKEVVVVKCGIGKVNAAMCTQILADIYKVSAIINTGVAGSLNNDIDICDIVISKDALEHDMDVTPLGYDKGVIPDMDKWIFESSTELMELATLSVKKAGLDVKVFTGRVASGDQFIAGKAIKDQLGDLFNADCAEMEGASIAHVSYLNNIPFLIIRAISDKADGSAELDYPSFEKKAAANSIALLKQMIAEY